MSFVFLGIALQQRRCVFTKGTNHITALLTVVRLEFRIVLEKQLGICALRARIFTLGLHFRVPSHQDVEVSGPVALYLRQSR